MVGIGVMIENEKGEVLLGLRKGSHGAGQWCFPGGHLEFGETIFETAKREVKEETNLDAGIRELISIADDLSFVKTDGKHYVTLGVRALCSAGEPRVMEPDKFDAWKWFARRNVPEEVFVPTTLMLRNYKAGTIYQPN